MAQMGLVVDCSAQDSGESVRALTDSEVAALQVAVEEADAVGAAQDAVNADRADARRQLKAKAKSDATLALIARALNLDPSAPDPTKPPAG